MNWRGLAHLTAIVSVCACSSPTVAPLPDDASTEAAQDGAPAEDAAAEGHATSEDSSISGDSSPDAPSPRDGGAEEASNLPSVPEVEGGYPQCFASTSPEAGGCCYAVACIDDAGASCPSAGDVGPRIAQQLGVVLGTCYCGASGPYDPASAERYDASGSCCYVVGAQGCI